MTEQRIDPSEQIPEADWLEQRTPLDPNALLDAESAPLTPDLSASIVEEADRLEQQAVLPDEDEDDYPHDSSVAASS